MSDLLASTWSEIDTANTASPPNGFPEGMDPSGLNNGTRAMMGGIKRTVDRIMPIKTTAGSSTVYTLTYDQAQAKYYDGELTAFVVNQACGNALTLNIDGLGARPLRKWVGSYAPLTSGDLQSGLVIVVRYNLADSPLTSSAARAGYQRAPSYRMPALRLLTVTCCALVRQSRARPTPPYLLASAPPTAWVTARPPSTCRTFAGASRPAKTTWAALLLVSRV